MRDDLGDDGMTQHRLVWILRQSDMNVVVRAAEQVALDAFAISLRQRIVLVDVRMAGIEDETDKRYRVTFAEFGAVAQRKDVCEFGAARRRLAFGNAGLVGAGVTKIAEGLQCDGCDLIDRRAEIIFHRILLVVGGAFVTAGVAAKKVYSLGLICEWFELKRKRLAAPAERHLLRLTRSHQQKDGAR